MPRADGLSTLRFEPSRFPSYVDLSSLKSVCFYLPQEVFFGPSLLRIAFFV